MESYSNCYDHLPKMDILQNQSNTQALTIAEIVCTFMNDPMDILKNHSNQVYVAYLLAIKYEKFSTSFKNS